MLTVELRTMIIECRQVEEQSSTRDRVMFDRNMIVDAAVVRILKAKKQIRHAELITQVVDATKSCVGNKENSSVRGPKANRSRASCTFAVASLQTYVRSRTGLKH